MGNIMPQMKQFKNSNEGDSNALKIKLIRLLT